MENERQWNLEYATASVRRRRRLGDENGPKRSGIRGGSFWLRWSGPNDGGGTYVFGFGGRWSWWSWWWESGREERRRDQPSVFSEAREGMDGITNRVGWGYTLEGRGGCWEGGGGEVMERETDLGEECDSFFIERRGRRG